ncbi:MAG: hypothetical protein JSS72_01745 [Armatimonadetes bacterium]|nr:hypothetical protein [Armatimonadota bacterium]
MITDWQSWSPPVGSPLFALISGPTEPEYWRACQEGAAESLGLGGRYFHFAVEQSDFHPLVEQLREWGFVGANVAEPYLVMAARLAPKLFVSRFSLGVANVLHFSDEIYAMNSEVHAFGTILSGVTPGRALILGSGRSAREAGLYLLDAGWKVRVWSQSLRRMKLLQSTLARYVPIEICAAPDPSDCSLVINCTNIGRKAGEKPPLEWRAVRPRTAFIDTVYRRVPTEFLREASLRGFRTVDGREVIVESLAASWHFWIQKRPDINALRVPAGLKPFLNS